MLSRFTVCQAKLEAAIKVVVAENPILRGRMEKDAGDAMPGTGWRITADAHSDGFFEVFEGPGDFVVPDTLGERLSMMRAVIEPLMLERCLGSAMQQTADGSQLFKVVVMTLPGNHAIYAVSPPPSPSSARHPLPPPPPPRTGGLMARYRGAGNFPMAQ